MEFLKQLFENILIRRTITSLIIILVAFIIYKVLKKVINKIFELQSKNISKKKQNTLKAFFTNMVRFIIVLLTGLLVLEVFGFDTGVIITSLGAVTVVIGLAFQDLLKDFIAGISLTFQNSYNVGDTITVNGFKGEVISMGMKATKLKAASGDILIINNGAINEIINHTIANSLAVVDVGVAYESDIEKVESILNKLAKNLSKKIPELKGEITVLGVEALGDSAVVFRITAEVEANKQYQIQRELRKQIKIELDKNNISIPYNQLVIHNG